MSRLKRALTLEEIREMVLRLAKPYIIQTKDKRATGVRNWCAAHGVHATHVCSFLSGQRPPPADMLNALGLEWSVTVKDGGPIYGSRAKRGRRG